MKVSLAVLLLAALGIFFDIFIVGSRSDLRALFLISLWILSVRLHKFEARISIAVGLALLTLCPFVLIFDQGSIAKKVAIWTYLFLLVGVVQKIIGSRSEI